MKICFIGAGALGSSIGGVLAAGGADVVLVDHFAAHVDAINTFGLNIRIDDEEKIVKVRACSDCQDIGIVDLVIVLVKSFHTRSAIESARPLIGENTMVMSIQNGMGHEEILAVVS